MPRRKQTKRTTVKGIRTILSNRQVPSAETSPRQCAVRWMARKDAPQPEPRRFSPKPLLFARSQQLRAQIRKARAAPQGQLQTDVAKLPRVFDLDSIRANRDRDITRPVIEQRRLFRSANQMTGERLRLKPSLHVNVAKLGHRLLNNTPANPDAAHQCPVAMDLSRLSLRGVAQIHALNQSRFDPRKNSLGRHYIAKSKLLRGPTRGFDSLRRQNGSPFGGHFAQVGLACGNYSVTKFQITAEN